ncbi:hypothetical protein LOCC1_G007706 [Lachnellula occidentalis]|uniref:Uncharacterized protein n=1 Tax=Lachnellula occidentalis TaxID=215460 RepID=A0A8H8RF98_9HELO|nr:hypothetical protein LOCC1_G007706 [Lachnellula occidentalis]
MSSTPSHTPKSAHRSYNPHPGSSSTSTPFTASMRDRQARNKDYPSSEDSDSSWDGPSGRFDANDSYGNDSYANTQLRRDAAIKLDNPELVMMLAMARNDSIPATRNYLTKIMCGFATQEELEAEEALRDQMEREKEREKEKGKTAGSGSGSGSAYRGKAN